MRFLKFWTLFASLVVTASPALTSEREIGKTVIKVTDPNGQCELTGATPRENEINKKMRDIFAKSHQVIALYVNCDQLKAFRQNSGGVQDFAQYIIQIGLVDRIVPEILISQVCDASRKVPTTTLEQITKNAQSEIHSQLGARFEQVNFLGVLAEEPGACYTGNVTDQSAGRLQLSIVANVLVKGKLITYQIYGPYRGKRSVDELLNRHKANVAAFKKINVQ